MNSVTFVILSVASMLITTTQLTIADQEPITFAFSLDTTSSMHDEISAVIKGIKQIIDQNVRQIEDYIVVPFKDPDVGPSFKSHDKNEIKSYLDTIRVSGGGDCPEMAMTGLLLAIARSRPNSFIFFFSDASPKDYFKSNEVTAAANSKGVKIYFILTGCCGDCKSREFSAYTEVERNADAKIYQISKSGVEKFMDYVVAAAVSDLNKLRNAPKTFDEIPEKTEPLPPPAEEVPEVKAKKSHCSYFVVIVMIVVVMVFFVALRRRNRDHQD